MSFFLHFSVFCLHFGVTLYPKKIIAFMNTKINEFEVMAPVGSRESLAAAIQAGADSVYFGIGKLNMRSHSANHLPSMICVR